MSVLHVICVSDAGISPKVTSAIQKRLENQESKHLIISLSHWYGPKSIDGVRVKLLFKSSLKRFLRELRHFSLHPKSYADTTSGSSFYLDPSKLKNVLDIDADCIFIYSDSWESSMVLSSLISTAGHSKSSHIEIVLIKRFDVGSSKQDDNPTDFISPDKSLLIIQPDWEYCGSAKTFDLIGNLAVSNGFSPVRISTGTDFKKQKIQIGKLHSNGPDAEFPGIGAKINLSSSKSKAILFRNLLKYLFSSNRQSVVSFKNQIYGSLRLERNVEKVLERLSPEYIYVNHHFNLSIALRIQKHLSKGGLRPKVILDSHDLQFRNYKDQNYKSPLSMYFGGAVDEMSLELSQFRDADAVVFVSEEERQFYLDYLDRHQYKHNRTFYSIPIRYGEQRSIKPPTLSNNGLSVGIFMADNSANRISLNWFFQNALPSFADLHVHFVVYGGISKVQNIFSQSEKVQFRGFVESIADAYAAVDIVCMPVVLGNGVSIKTLEALEFERPIIGTALAGRGLPVNDSILFASNSDQFIERMRMLILSQSARDEQLQEAKTLKDRISQISYEKQFRDFFV
jgi:hypothetical protein